MDEMMAAWMKYAQPGDGHKYLQRLAGAWETKATFWMNPGGPPMQTTGTSINEMIMGGRFLKADYSASFMGSPFQGMSLDGYDMQKQKYVGLWMDTMGTMMLIFEGTCEGNVRTMMTDYTNPMTGKPAKMKGVTTVIGENEHKYEAWATGPDGKMFKNMEVVYTRK